MIQWWANYGFSKHVHSPVLIDKITLKRKSVSDIREGADCCGHFHNKSKNSAEVGNSDLFRDGNVCVERPQGIMDETLPPN